MPVDYNYPQWDNSEVLFTLSPSFCRRTETQMSAVGGYSLMQPVLTFFLHFLTPPSLSWCLLGSISDLPNKPTYTQSCCWVKEESWMLNFSDFFHVQVHSSSRKMWKNLPIFFNHITFFTNSFSYLEQKMEVLWKIHEKHLKNHLDKKQLHGKLNFSKLNQDLCNSLFKKFQT